jgi:hypothetical protein
LFDEVYKGDSGLMSDDVLTHSFTTSGAGVLDGGQRIEDSEPDLLSLRPDNVCRIRGAG